MRRGAREVGKAPDGDGHAAPLRRSRRSGSQLSGKTSNNNTVNFTGPRDLIGAMADVLISADAGSSLRGELAAPLPAAAQGRAAANWI